MEEREQTTVTSNAEEYLETIYRLSHQDEGVTASQIARVMNISMASVTGMLKRLNERNLVIYNPYKGVNLTDSGKQIALELIRRHRLSERFLTDMLGLSWEKAHEEACKFEHIITGELEERMSQVLGNPATCPHGHPLDATQQDQTIPLATLNPVQSGVIVKINDEESEFLQYLATLGLMPGVSVEVTAKAPFNGPLMVRVGSATYALGQDVARKISVSREEPM